MSKALSTGSTIVSSGAQAADSIWQAVDPKSYDKKGQKIIGGINTGSLALNDWGTAIGEMGADPTTFQENLDISNQITKTGGQIGAEAW